MAHTSVGLVVRQQGWFRAHVAPESVEPFALEKAKAVSIQPTGSFRVRVLIGRGPVDYELTPEFLLWFEHGEQEYPVFQCPSIGPSGAGLKMSSRPRKIVAGENDVVAMIEISVVQPVASSFPQVFEQQSQGDSGDAPAALVHRLQAEAATWLEQAIGMYALYQYPIVWEPLGVHPIVGFVDIENNAFRLTTRIEADNFIPFRLNAAARARDGELADNGLLDLARLSDGTLHLPLTLLQRSLWHRNIELRFLETFLILDYLTGERVIEDAGRPEREKMFDALDAFVRSKHPEFQERLTALKHVVLQAPLRQRLGAYFKALGMEVDDRAIGRLLRARNDLAHARKIDDAEIAAAEVEVRQLAREALRRELSGRGVKFEKPAGAT
jgi:hypothetical protein